MTWSILEMARSLRTCPLGVLARAPLGPPRAEPLPVDLSGLVPPWGEGALDAIGLIPDAVPEAGATWLPLHGRVAWTLDPHALTHDDALTCWMRTRLTDAFHAARAALLCGDEGAARMAVGIVAAFRARHPLGSSPAWDGAMEASLRAVRLIHIGALLREARHRHGWSSLDLSAVALALAEHEAHLRARCDWRLHFTGNHHLVALAGAFTLAAHLPSSPARTRRARALFALFWREFCREMGPDGVHFESSTGYHLLAAETAAHVALAGLRLGLTPSRRATERLVACAAATASLARPDGTLAAIGDSDDGAFLDLKPSPEPPIPLDARPALALLALATGHADAAAKALGSARAREAAAWLVGSEASSRLEALAATARDAAPRPAIFVDGGLVILGTAGDPVAHVTISCTTAGRMGTGGHGHDDAGAYELWLGEPVIVDRGTGAYARDPGLRHRLRAVASHSVVQVDAREMNGSPHGDGDGLFRREERAKPLMTGYSSSQGGAVAIGHHGFCRAPSAITVLRSLTLSRDGELEVEDELVGSGEHDVILRLPLAPGLRATFTQEGSGTHVKILRDRDGVLVATCEVEGLSAEGLAIPPRARAEEAIHAPRQLEFVPAVTVEMAWRLSLPARIQHRARAARA